MRNDSQVAAEQCHFFAARPFQTFCVKKNFEKKTLKKNFENFFLKQIIPCYLSRGQRVKGKVKMKIFCLSIPFHL